MQPKKVGNLSKKLAKKGPNKKFDHFRFSM